MYYYDAQYRHLRDTGFQGWAGHHYEQGLARLTETLNRLQREGVFPKPPARILELGCGNGMMSSFLMTRKGYEAHGIDISGAAVAWAAERFALAGLVGSFREGTVCAMPFFIDGAFDIIIDGSCLHCLIGDDRTRCLGEVRRILRPGGVFIVSSMCGLPKSDDSKARFDPLTCHLLENGEPYRTLKLLVDLELELVDAGFEVRDSSLRINPWWDHVTIVCR